MSVSDDVNLNCLIIFKFSLLESIIKKSNSWFVVSKSFANLTLKLKKSSFSLMKLTLLIVK